MSTRGHKSWLATRAAVRTRRNAVLISVGAGLAILFTLLLGDIHDFPNLSAEALIPVILLSLAWLLAALFAYRSLVVRPVRDSEDQMTSLFEVAPFALAIARLSDGRILYANRQCLSILGVSADDIIGQRMDWYALEEGDAQRLLKAMSETVESAEQEIGFRRRDGSPVWTSATYRKLTLHGEEVAIGCFVDITDRRRAEEQLRESEQRYRSVVDNIGIGVALISPQMEILALNSRMRMWNPTVDPSTRPLCYRAFNDPPRDGICTYCPTDKTLQDGQVHESVSETPTAGGTVNYRIVASPILDKDGRIVAAIEMVEDVTERLRVEEQQKRYTQDLEYISREQARLTRELARSKRETEEALARLKEAQASIIHSEKMASIGVLASGIAHEINNPIGYVSANLRELINYTDKIRAYLMGVQDLEACVVKRDMESAAHIQKGLDELKQTQKLDFVLSDLQDIVRESLEGAASVETIVKALKSYARQDDEAMSPLDLLEIVDNSIRVVGNQIKVKAEIIKQYQPVPPVLGHSGALHQVFSNLLVNAAQAIPSHGLIMVRAFPNDHFVTVQIIDNGHGIQPEHLPRVFEPFFTTKDVGQGTGLGLSIAYDIVKKHGGDISVESEPDRETVFTVRFPVASQAIGSEHGESR
jgi:PAS domain S-box-containing protein